MVAIPDADDPRSSPAAGLAELQAGNRRFVAGTRIHPNQDAEHRAGLADAQDPFAVIFGCSDSRLAAEIIFDQGLGDLFVVRTAGHTIGPEVLGSIEYAVTVLNTHLVVVLGHNSCGAVRAAYDAVSQGSEVAGYLGAVVDAIEPSVRRAISQHTDATDDVEQIHIEHTVTELVSQSAVMAAAVTTGSCAVVGMYYQLSAGEARLVVGPPR
ncbi:MAG: carbonic anhydrase [Sporichthyaceae bacterium]|nr:carbonic anhydrase [Sporichthyaceae bacterium]